MEDAQVNTLIQLHSDFPQKISTYHEVPEIYLPKPH